MRSSFIFATLLFLTCSASAQQFPTLSGETADGVAVTLPKKNAKAFTVIGIAYDQKAATVMEAWYEPAYLRFIAQHGLFAGEYDADTYFIPMFVGANKAAYGSVLKQFKASADPEIVDHVMFSKQDIEPLVTTLDMGNKNIPYFFILDATGKIVHREQGEFNEDKLEAMEDVMLE